MADARDLVSTSGKPLFKEPNIIVVKCPRSVHIDQRILQEICRLTGCIILNLPMDAEFMMGTVAEKEMLSIHSAIHAITQIPEANFTKEELKVLYAAMRYLCEHTTPTEGSPEVKLMKTIKKYVA